MGFSSTFCRSFVVPLRISNLSHIDDATSSSFASFARYGAMVAVPCEVGVSVGLKGYTLM